MRWIIHIITLVFRGVTAPFLFLGETLGLLLISAVMGVVLLLIFKGISNQKKIQAVRNQITAAILELRLYQDDLFLMFKALGSALRYNGIYLKYMLKPLIFLMIPVILLVGQLSRFYTYRPYLPGERVIVTALFQSNINLEDVGLKTEDGLALDMNPVRMPREQTIVWRLRVDDEGDFPVELMADDRRASFVIHAGRDVKSVTAWSFRPGAAKSLIHPVNQPLAKNSFVRQLMIDYPAKRFAFLGLPVNWLFFFFLVSVLTGFAIKNKLKVEI